MWKGHPFEERVGETEEREECGSCGAFHKVSYAGDCRNDAERFGTDGLD